MRLAKEKLIAEAIQQEVKDIKKLEIDLKSAEKEYELS